MSSVSSSSKSDKEPKLSEITVGDIVLWYPDAHTSNPPIAAIVTAVSACAGHSEPILSINKIRPDQPNFTPAKSIRHVNDPFWKNPEVYRVAQRDGAWGRKS